MKDINYYFLMLGILFCVTLVYSQDQKNDKIPIPIKPRYEDVVSLDMAKKIGVVMTQKKFGSGVIGEPIIGYDLNGNIRVYIIPFRVGKSVFPIENEILRNIENTRQLLPEVKKELAKVREASLELKKEEIKFEKKGKKMFLIKNKEWEDVEQRVKDIENKCWGIGEYGTIVVSGRKELMPIPEYSNALPYYYTYRDIVEELAKQKLGNNVFLARFYYGGDLDQIFEFESADGEQIWVALFPPRVVKPGEITPREIMLTEEQREQIKEKWDEIMKEVQNEK